MGRSPIVAVVADVNEDADAVTQRPARQYALPAHLVAAAAALEGQEADRRKRGLVTLGGAAVDRVRFGAAFRRGVVDGVGDGAPGCEVAPACDGVDPTGRFGRPGRSGQFKLACFSVMVTVALAGVGMTVTSTSAPANEAALPRSTTTAGGPAGGGSLVGGVLVASGAQDAAATGLTEGSGTATATGAEVVRTSMGGAVPGAAGAATEAATNGTEMAAAVSNGSDGTEIAAYPSFSAGSLAGSGPETSTATSGAADGTGAAFGSLPGFSPGATPATSGFGRGLNSIAGSGVPASGSGTASGAAGAGSSDTSLSGIVVTGTGGIGTGITDTNGSGTGGIGTSTGSIEAGSTGSGSTDTNGSGTGGIGTGGIGTGGPGDSVGPVIGIGGTGIGGPILVIAGPRGGEPCCTVTQVVVVDQQPVQVPEPATLALLAAGAAVAGLARRRVC